MTRVISRLVITGLAVFVVGSVALAQSPGARPQYSAKDQLKLAEIAVRRDVVEQINAAWDSARRQDIEFSFRVNTAATLGDWRGDPQWLDVWSKYGRLYDNPVLVNYVNALGQRLVPKDSPNLYAFRLLLDPTPRAEALTTGTIYVSTGMVSLLDNEAQLAYVLAHEIAHVERNHMYETIKSEIFESELDKVREKSAQVKKAIFSVAGALTGGVLGRLLGGEGGIAIGATIGALVSGASGAVLYRNKFAPTRWDAVHENEADQAGMAMLLAQKFDVREVPKIYARLRGLVSKDTRLGLGFMGDPGRVGERTAYVEDQIAVALKPTIDADLAGSGLVGSSPEFAVLMAALKRDNGIIAMTYDLMAMAKDNLQGAAQLRSNDPRVHYYLGKLYALTGRTPEEKQLAVTHLRNAIMYDDHRGSYPDPHLEYAVHLIAQNDPASQPEICESLKKYVTTYQRSHGGEVPLNIDVVYDYLQIAGEESWYAPPVAFIAPRNGEPLPVVSQAVAAPVALPVKTPLKIPVKTPVKK